MNVLIQPSITVQQLRTKNAITQLAPLHVGVKQATVYRIMIDVKVLFSFCTSSYKIFHLDEQILMSARKLN